MPSLVHRSEFMHAVSMKQSNKSQSTHIQNNRNIFPEFLREMLSAMLPSKIVFPQKRTRMPHVLLAAQKGWFCNGLHPNKNKKPD